MKNRNLSIDEINNYDTHRIKNEPENFGDLSSDERRAWIRAELASGDYRLEKSLSIRDLVYFGYNLLEWCPEFDLYQVLLEAYDPAEVEPYIVLEDHAVLFLKTYGLERAQAFVSDQTWLKVMQKPVYTKLENETRNQVKLLLQRRGPERIAPLIQDKTMGPLFIEIFGLESSSFLPKDLAKQIKGQHLANELGL